MRMAGHPNKSGDTWAEQRADVSCAMGERRGTGSLNDEVPILNDRLVEVARWCRPSVNCRFMRGNLGIFLHCTFTFKN